ncbi:MAG: FxDxF family PEP-CTERM protein [Betaproteobacteria bacterium]
MTSYAIVDHTVFRSRTRTLVAVTALSVGLIGHSGAMAAQLSRSDIAAPGYFVSAVGGLANGNGFNVGDVIPILPGESVSNSAQGSSLFGVINQSATYSNVSQHVQTQSNGSAGFGVINLFADFSGPNSAQFPVSVVTGGWVDSLLFNLQGHTGESGLMSFGMHVEGTLESLAGFNSLAGFGLRPYVDDQFLSTVPSALIFQGQGQIGFPYNETVDTIVTFNIPFTFGTAFELGIFANAIARTASQGAVEAINTATVDFSNTITWNGISAVTLNGQAVDYDLTSASGVDWRTATVTAVPEPETYVMLLAGLGLLGFVARRRQRDAAA